MEKIMTEGKNKKREPSSKKKKKKRKASMRGPHMQDLMGFLTETFQLFSFQKLLSDNLKTMFPIVYAFRSKTFFLEHLYT